MKKLLIFTLLISCCCFIYGQKVFDKGYFIDSMGVKTECLIKNYDKQNNPSKIEIKRSESDPAKTLSIDEISEFGIDGFSHFIRAKVKIDISSTNLENLSEQKKPIWKDTTIFLRILIDGKARLYNFASNETLLYFYSTENTDISQLIYKLYIIDYKLGENNGFRQQLKNMQSADSFINYDVSKISYKKSDLEKYFIRFNGTENSEKKKIRNTREIFNFKLTSGIEYSNISVSNGLTNHYDASLRTPSSFRCGFETEMFIPLNKNKISLLIEPHFQYLNAYTSANYYEKFIVNYQTVEFPIGIRYRHYFNKSSLFLNAHITPNFYFNFNSNIKYFNTIQFNQITNTTFPIRISPYFSLGAGYQYKNSGIELRWNFKRNLLNMYMTFDAFYENASLIYSYKLYTKKSQK